MPTKQSQPVEINNFSQGLITEASPLNFPPNATSDEQNFTLNKDGTRDRRFGIDYEDGHSELDSGYKPLEGFTAATNTFLWNGVGENDSLIFNVIQIGSNLHIHNQDNAALSSSRIATVTVGTSRSVRIAMTQVDGDLVAVNGDGNIYIIEYDEASNTFSQSSRRIVVRDTFGQKDISGSKDLNEANNVAFRPVGKTNAHVYNLRNQSWGPPRGIKGKSPDGALGDCMHSFLTTAFKYPSNADVQFEHIKADPDDDQQEDRFFAKAAKKAVPYHLAAARGYFLIDLMNRGTSRDAAYADNMAANPELTITLTGNLPADSTPGGATAVAEYAGRVWYAGFSGDVTDGDDRSPRLSSYIAFSQLVNTPAQTVNCYQEGDPTSPEASDVVDTDGGLIRISGLERCIRLVSLKSGLFIIGTNGIWRIAGGADEGFTATNVIQGKVAPQAPASGNTVVEVEDTLLFWAADGIYQVAPNEVGQWASKNITQGTIQTFYDAIPDKGGAHGFFDNFTREARWVYETATDTRELILDTTLGAFRSNVFMELPSGDTPTIRGYAQAAAFAVGTAEEGVDAEFEDVLVGSESVGLDTTILTVGPTEVKYLVIFDDGTNVMRYTFAAIINTGFVDWQRKDFDDNGVDAFAYMNTGAITAGDTSVRKQVPYLTFHMTKTETGFDSDFNPLNVSSCIAQIQWDFADSPAAGKWGREFECYKHRRLFIPESSSDPFDDGHSIVTTRNKLRGRGRAFSLFLHTTAGKDCKIQGWNLTVNGNPKV